VFVFGEFQRIEREPSLALNQHFLREQITSKMLLATFVQFVGDDHSGARFSFNPQRKWEYRTKVKTNDFHCFVVFCVVNGKVIGITRTRPFHVIPIWKKSRKRGAAAAAAAKKTNAKAAGAAAYQKDLDSDDDIDVDEDEDDHDDHPTASDVSKMATVAEVATGTAASAPQSTSPPVLPMNRISKTETESIAVPARSPSTVARPEASFALSPAPLSATIKTGIPGLDAYAQVREDPQATMVEPPSPVRASSPSDFSTTTKRAIGEQSNAYRTIPATSTTKRQEVEQAMSIPPNVIPAISVPEQQQSVSYPQYATMGYMGGGGSELTQPQFVYPSSVSFAAVGGFQPQQRPLASLPSGIMGLQQQARLYLPSQYESPQLQGSHQGFGYGAQGSSKSAGNQPEMALPSPTYSMTAGWRPDSSYGSLMPASLGYPGTALLPMYSSSIPPTAPHHQQQPFMVPQSLLRAASTVRQEQQQPDENSFSSPTTISPPQLQAGGESGGQIGSIPSYQRFQPYPTSQHQPSPSPPPANWGQQPAPGMQSFYYPAPHQELQPQQFSGFPPSGYYGSLPPNLIQSQPQPQQYSLPPTTSGTSQFSTDPGISNQYQQLMQMQQQQQQQQQRWNKSQKDNDES
jgi:hypothetical protein